MRVYRPDPLGTQTELHSSEPPSLSPQGPIHSGKVTAIFQQSFPQYLSQGTSEPYLYGMTLRVVTF